MTQVTFQEEKYLEAATKLVLVYADIEALIIYGISEMEHHHREQGMPDEIWQRKIEPLIDAQAKVMYAHKRIVEVIKQ